MRPDLAHSIHKSTETDLDVCHSPDVTAASTSDAPADAGRRVRLGIVDDHQMVLDTLTSWITASDADLDVTVAVPTWGELLEDAEFPVDVVLLDLDLSDQIPATVKIVSLLSADVATVIMSAHADPQEIRACIAAGALAYVPKSEPAAEIAKAVKLAAIGESHWTPRLAQLIVADREDAKGKPGRVVPALSPQETRVLVLYASGMPMKSVAPRLSISYDTAKDYIDRVRDKYRLAGREARTKVDLHRRAVEDGLLNHHDE